MYIHEMNGSRDVELANMMTQLRNCEAIGIVLRPQECARCAVGG